MCDLSNAPEFTRLSDEIYADLVQEGGNVFSGEPLRRALGFKSLGAMNKAIARKKVSLPFFRMPERRGKFVLARELARFIAKQRLQAGLTRE